MKQHLVNLLLEEFKQKCYIDDLATKGIYLKHICVNNFDIVLDIIGFPKDSTLEYDFHNINSGGETRDENVKRFEEDCFCRDRWICKYGDTIDKLWGKQKVIVTGMGIEIGSEAYIKKVEKKLSEFVDWLS